MRSQLVNKMTNKEIDTWWKERATNCSKELEIMDYRVRQYDGDTYNWIIWHKNKNGAMSETYLSHKDLVKFTEALKADTLHPKFVERLMAFDQLQKQSKSKPERVKEVGVVYLNIPEVKPPMPTAPAQPPQKKDKLEEALKRIESLDAEIKRLRLQEANNILLAWGGVCPSDWAISGDPTQMAEIIRQRGDELQTENLRLKSELIEVTKILKILEDEE